LKATGVQQLMPKRLKISSKKQRKKKEFKNKKRSFFFFWLLKYKKRSFQVIQRYIHIAPKNKRDTYIYNMLQIVLDYQKKKITNCFFNLGCSYLAKKNLGCSLISGL
jgi:hypothetical protein